MIPAALGPLPLEKLASLLERGRLQPPFAPGSFGRHLSAALRADAAAALSALGAAGLESRHMALVLRQVAAERRVLQRVQDQTELVWSGPEGPASASRDTETVVRELFREAQRSVLLANYAFDRPRTDEARARARDLFQPLAENADRTPALRVRFFVNVARPSNGRPGSEEPAAVLLRAFAARFVGDLWPGTRPPELYYDPRALEPWVGNEPRASMHAKCLVVDDEQVLLTSANFTEAAQVRNIEAGVRQENPFLARSLREQFEALVRAGQLLPIEWNEDAHR